MTNSIYCKPTTFKAFGNCFGAMGTPISQKISGIAVSLNPEAR
jgi:hypothetical protein